MNLKIDRLNSTFEREISKILATEVKDKHIKFVTTIKALKKAKSFIRGELSKRVEIRHTPELRFIFDQSIEYGNKIDKLIDKIHHNNE